MNCMYLKMAFQVKKGEALHSHCPHDSFRCCFCRIGYSNQSSNDISLQEIQLDTRRGGYWAWATWAVARVVTQKCSRDFSPNEIKP
jgi:hypothetical protein